MVKPFRSAKSVFVSELLVEHAFHSAEKVDTQLEDSGELMASERITRKNNPGYLIPFLIFSVFEVQQWPSLRLLL